MANYYGVGKTNLFAVKDLDAFVKAVEHIAVEVGASEQDGQTLVQLFDNDSNGGGFPYEFWNEEFGEHEEINWEAIFARHLVDGWVAIIYEVGNEKYRHLAGNATAFNSKGETRSIDIHDITKLAEQIGSKF